TGVVAEWYVKTGDPVTEGQPIWSVETDKVTQDAYAPATGTMGEIVANVGDVVEPEQVVAYVETEVGARGGGAPAGGGGLSATTARTETPSRAATETLGDPAGRRTATSDASGVAAQAARAATSVARDEETALAIGQKSPADTDVAPAMVQPEPTAEPSASPRAGTTYTGNGRAAGDTATLERGTAQPHRYSPRTRRLIREHGLTEADLAGIQGSGRGGRVRAGDVERFLASGRRAEATRPATAATPAPPSPQAGPVVATVPATAALAPKPAAQRVPLPVPAPVGQEQVETQKLTTIRKTIATYLRNSVDNAVHCTTIDEADVTNLVSLRNRLKDQTEERFGIKLTYTSFIARATALALREFPLINSVLDLQNEQVHVNHHIHLGIAVDAPAGLMVPVVRFADTKSVLQLQTEIEALAAKARDSKITLEELQ
ncbi:MAG TPA: 2-oxo acid dehydrogenase subunit E2, partial [bacterium]|nr:2-oxo acid dehydrogenase subunit E2 [bacterium]